MRIIAWAPVTDIDWTPPFGKELVKHIKAYKNRDVRCVSCSAWVLLYNVLIENGLEYGQVVFDKRGKPSFSDCKIYFSLSHSKGVCAVAVSDQPIGIDVELCRKKYNDHLVERSLSEKEKIAFDGDFTRFWCRKESIAKLTGKGITGYPNDIDSEDKKYHFYEERICLEEKNYWLVAGFYMSG